MPEDEYDSPQDFLDDLEEKVENQKRIAKQSGDKVTKERLTLPNKKKMRNLKQYKNLDDSEYDERYAQKIAGVEFNREFEGRIQKKIDEFKQDYDVDNLNINDKLMLRALAQALINLEDFETMSYNMRQGGIDFGNLSVSKELATMLNNLRRDIGTLQDGLNITRRLRASDKETSIVTEIEDQKKKAKEFYASKMSYIFCPKCNMLLATVWTLYPELKDNKMTFVCNRPLDEKTKCGHKFTVTTKELLEKRGTNKVGILPESMK